uniref:NR LBD domain-containing protein n=1 Tax=Caenorhabditis japonica TaxID=281687 RepID=A0A8R1DRC0_CAEJA
MMTDLAKEGFVELGEVQLDYDPTYSFRGLIEDSGSDDNSSPSASPSQSEYSPESSRSRKSSRESPGIDPNILFTFTPKPQNKPNMKIDFTALVSRIDEMFAVKLEEDVSELESLTAALDRFRQTQKPLSQVSFLGTVDVTTAVEWTRERIYKYACWFASSKTFMGLREDQKMPLFRSSWNTNFLLTDEFAMVPYQTHVDLASISELPNQYFNQLFEPFLARYFEEVAKPLLDLKPTSEEVAFCMIHLVGLDDCDISTETQDALEQLREQIADQIHVYYTNRTDIKMYSHRLLALMKLVKAMKRISREKTKIKELIWLFDIYHADISEPYFFEIF